MSKILSARREGSAQNAEELSVLLGLGIEQTDQNVLCARKEAYVENPDKKKAMSRAYYATDPERKKATSRAHSKRSYGVAPDKKKVVSRAYYAADPERKKATARAYYAIDPERKKATSRAYSKRIKRAYVLIEEPGMYWQSPSLM